MCGRVIFAGLLAVALLAAGCAGPKATVGLREVMSHELGRELGDLPNLRCTLGAHRGSSVVHRENTLPALLAAEDDPRFAFIEFDVQYTADNRIVVFHDQRLFRLYGRTREVGEITYAELYAATDGEIVLFRDLMARLRNKPLNIEIKSQGDVDEDARLADEVVAIVRALGREEDVMISSISSDAIRYVKQAYPEFPTGLILWLTSSTYLHLDPLTARLYETFTGTGADYLMLHVANLRNLEKLLALKPPDKTIVFWDFDDRMVLVHRDPGDRLWGTSRWADFWAGVWYRITP
jgi:glycerophosphoryl diester phosphodiesterase